VFCSNDGKDTLKSYTNPIFFFELWCSQIQKEVEKKRPTGKKLRVCDASHFYTVNHKKRDILFLTIILVSRDRFL